MHGHSTVKKGLKILFLFIQSIFIILSIFISILLIILHTKLKTYLNFGYKPLFCGFFISILYFLSSFLGIFYVYKKKKLYLYIFDVLLIILMNIDLIIISLEHYLIKNTISYTSKRWNVLEKDQKLNLQNKLSCCGFNNKSDRSEGSCDNVGCKDVFVGISEGIRKKSTRFLIGTFLLKSLGLALGSTIKRKKKKKMKVVYNKENHKLEIK